MYRFTHIILILFLSKGLVNGQNVIINEFASSNVELLLDIDGNSSDWIELYNNTNTTINLDGYSLSDDENNLNKWNLPAIDILANDYLLIFASGEDKVDLGELHTNFKISQEGEKLFLSYSSAGIISETIATFVPTNQSFGSITDGSLETSIFNSPTPNASNSNGNGIVNLFDSGFYNDEFFLDFQLPSSEQEIYYTLNGDIPSINSLRYTTPIHIQNYTDLANSFSLIPTTPLEGPFQLSEYIWKTPKSVYNANIIRYASFENGIQKSDLFTKTYFVDGDIQERYNFPIVSIVTDSLHLFENETGVYIPGKRFDDNGFEWWPQGNYLYRGEDWEREVHLTYFKEDGTVAFETDAGFRMKGFGSASLPQKSFGIYFREEYGRKNIEYPVFDSLNVDKYKRLLFRNSGNDFLSTHFRDALLQKILHPLEMETQNLKPSIVFINGEYWGIHNIREKYDKFYFSEHFNIEEEEVNILGHCGDIEEGTNIEYLELIEFIENNDLSTANNYNYIKEKVDILNFMDFQIAEIYFANYDWPCNNYKMWKNSDSESKWRFLIHDLDLSFGFANNSSVYTNSFLHSTSIENTWPHCECSNLLFRKLLTNDEFKEQFINRFKNHLKNVFSPEKINPLINKFEILYETEIQEHIDRWNYPVNKEKWKEEIDKLRFFVNNRTCVIYNHLITFFHLETFDFICNPNIGTINKNTILLYPNPNYGNFTLYNNLGEDFEGDITIFNFMGKKVYEKNNITIAKGEQHNVLTENLINGSYILIISNMKQTIKFVKIQ